MLEPTDSYGAKSINGRRYIKVQSIKLFFKNSVRFNGRIKSYLISLLNNANSNAEKDPNFIKSRENITLKFEEKILGKPIFDNLTTLSLFDGFYKYNQSKKKIGRDASATFPWGNEQIVRNLCKPINLKEPTKPYA